VAQPCRPHYLLVFEIPCDTHKPAKNPISEYGITKHVLHAIRNIT
jgi:hypothetical protein